MTEILSQDDIDALLAAISSGADKTDWSEDFNPSPSKEQIDKAEFLYRDLEDTLQAVGPKERKSTFKTIITNNMARLIMNEEKALSKLTQYQDNFEKQMKERLKVATLLAIALEKLSKDM